MKQRGEHHARHQQRHRNRFRNRNRLREPRHLRRSARARRARHGGGPGIEKVAASWAEARGVNQVICRPDWNAHGKAAPFRRNDELLNLLPTGVIAFPGSGITGNLVDKARQLGIPVFTVMPSSA